MLRIFRLFSTIFYPKFILVSVLNYGYNDQMQLNQKLEAVLFYKASPLKKTALAKLFAVEETELENAIKTLQERLKNGGTALFLTETEVELATNPELDEMIEGLRKDELKRDIGKAGAETLAIVLYKGPITRAEIDRIRGVNSGYILRNLEVRGLVEKTQSGRQNEFRITTELLRHLGITDKSELKDFTTVMNTLENYEKQSEEENQ